MQFHADHVGAGVGFGHGQRAHVFAAAQFGQVSGFLLLAAILAQLVQAQIGHGAVRQSDGRRGAADLLHHHGVGQVAHIAAAVALLHGDAEQAHGAELPPQIHAETHCCGRSRAARGAISFWHIW